MVVADRLRSLAARAQRRLERRLFALGDQVECPFCRWTGFRFLSAGTPRRGNRLCPRCGSLERYRMLPLVIERELTASTARVLELAPKPCFGTYCRGRPGWTYVSSDLASPTAMTRADLRRMPFADGSFDLIVVFHVMEHILDDAPAFAEIARMLSAGGVGIVCVPLDGAVTREGAPRADWTRLYGQDDHVRVYGIDIEQRMTAAGLAVTRLDTLSYFAPAQLDRHGLRGDDRYLFLVRKASSR